MVRSICVRVAWWLLVCGGASGDDLMFAEKEATRRGGDLRSFIMGETRCVPTLIMRRCVLYSREGLGGDGCIRRICVVILSSAHS
jgi:hypothetical protein